MKTYNRIVYRDSDEALVIETDESEAMTIVSLLGKLDEHLRIPLLALRDLCRQKIDDTLTYVVAYKGTNILNIEHEGGVIQIDITTLPNDELSIVSAGITACTEIINI